MPDSSSRRRSGSQGSPGDLTEIDGTPARQNFPVRPILNFYTPPTIFSSPSQPYLLAYYPTSTIAPSGGIGGSVAAQTDTTMTATSVRPLAMPAGTVRQALIFTPPNFTHQHLQQLQQLTSYRMNTSPQTAILPVRAQLAASSSQHNLPLTTHLTATAASAGGSSHLVAPQHPVQPHSISASSSTESISFRQASFVQHHSNQQILTQIHVESGQQPRIDLYQQHHQSFQLPQNNVSLTAGHGHLIYPANALTSPQKESPKRSMKRSPSISKQSSANLRSGPGETSKGPGRKRATVIQLPNSLSPGSSSQQQFQSNASPLTKTKRTPKTGRVSKKMKSESSSLDDQTQSVEPAQPVERAQSDEPTQVSKVSPPPLVQSIMQSQDQEQPQVDSVVAQINGIAQINGVVTPSNGVIAPLNGVVSPPNGAQTNLVSSQNNDIARQIRDKNNSDEDRNSKVKKQSKEDKNKNSERKAKKHSDVIFHFINGKVLYESATPFTNHQQQKEKKSLKFNKSFTRQLQQQIIDYRLQKSPQQQHLSEPHLQKQVNSSDQVVIDVDINIDNIVQKNNRKFDNKISDANSDGTTNSKKSNDLEAQATVCKKRVYSEEEISKLDVQGLKEFLVTNGFARNHADEFAAQGFDGESLIALLYDPKFYEYLKTYFKVDALSALSINRFFSETIRLKSNIAVSVSVMTASPAQAAAQPNNSI